MTKRDIKLFQENGFFDIGIENGDFIAEDGFDTAIWVSLFTDARADESQVVLTARFVGERVHLVGDTTPPAGSADFFVLNLDALAQRISGPVERHR